MANLHWKPWMNWDPTETEIWEAYCSLTASFPNKSLQFLSLGMLLEVGFSFSLQCLNFCINIRKKYWREYRFCLFFFPPSVLWVLFCRLVHLNSLLYLDLKELFMWWQTWNEVKGTKLWILPYICTLSQPVFCATTACSARLSYLTRLQHHPQWSMSRAAAWRPL